MHFWNIWERFRGQYALQKMINAIRTSSVEAQNPMNPLRNRINNYGSVHPLLDEEKVVRVSPLFTT